jgi:UPF0042 nucleotide-binding protein
MLDPGRSKATLIVMTTEGYVIRLISFGYKNGAPVSDKTFDIRYLPNPHNERSLRPLTGFHPDVQQFVRSSATARKVQKEVFDICKKLDSINDNTTVAVGCYGGRHRSVAMVEMVAQELIACGRDVTTRHRDADHG